MTSDWKTVKVKRTELAPCLTCPLCNRFFRDPTTIDECLHTFCRECIWKKLGEEKLRHCPVCNEDLGCNPVQKLRTDHNLRDLREKLFPLEDRVDEAPPVPHRRRVKNPSSSGNNNVGDKTLSNVDKAVSSSGDKTLSSEGDKTIFSFGDKPLTSVGDKSVPSLEDKTLSSVVDKSLPSLGDKNLSSIGEKTLSLVGDKNLSSLGGKTLSSVGDITLSSSRGKTISSVRDTNLSSLGGKTLTSAGDKNLSSLGKALSSVGDKTLLNLSSLGDKTLSLLEDKNLSSIGDKTLSSLGGKTLSSVGDKSVSSIKDKSLSSVGSKTVSSLGDNSTKLSSHSSICARRAETAAKKIAAAAAQAEKEERDLLNDLPRKLKLSTNRGRAAARKKTIPKHIPSSTFQPDHSAGDHHNGKEQQQNLEQLQTQNVVTEQVEYNQQKSSEPDPRHHNLSHEISEKNAELWKEKADMWEPLNFLREAARKVDNIESPIMQENAATDAMHVDAGDHNINNNNDKNEENPVQAEVNDVMTNKLKSSQERKVKFSQDLNIPALPEEDVADSSSKSNERIMADSSSKSNERIMADSSSKSNERIMADSSSKSNESIMADSSSKSNERIMAPIWFSLIASKDKEKNARLPQIPSAYLRVKDGNLPVSYVKKYIMMKLNLASESEVEISLQGRPLLSSLKLQNVVDMWLETVPRREKIKASVGSSAKDFVMVLSYGRNTN